MNDATLATLATGVGIALTVGGRMLWDRVRTNGNGRKQAPLSVQGLTADEVRRHYQDRVLWETATTNLMRDISDNLRETSRALTANCRTQRLMYRLTRHMAQQTGIDVSLTPAEVDEE